MANSKQALVKRHSLQFSVLKRHKCNEGRQLSSATSSSPKISKKRQSSLISWNTVGLHFLKRFFNIALTTVLLSQFIRPEDKMKKWRTTMRRVWENKFEMIISILFYFSNIYLWSFSKLTSPKYNLFRRPKFWHISLGTFICCTSVTLWKNYNFSLHLLLLNVFKHLIIFNRNWSLFMIAHKN